MCKNSCSLLHHPQSSIKWNEDLEDGFMCIRSLHREHFSLQYHCVPSKLWCNSTWYCYALLKMVDNFVRHKLLDWPTDLLLENARVSRSILQNSHEEIRSTQWKTYSNYTMLMGTSVIHRGWTSLIVVQHQVDWSCLSGHKKCLQ